MRDREVSEFKLVNKSYIRGTIDSHLKSLPLKINIESTYNTWDFYIQFDFYPTFDEYFVKTMESSLMIGRRYQNMISTFRSLKFLIYSYKACTVKIRPEFWISL